MNTVLDIATYLLIAVLVLGWSRLCFGAWTARHTTPATASEED